MYSSVVSRHIFHFYDTWSCCAINVHLWRHVFMYYVILSFSFKYCQHVHYENIQDARSFFIWHRKTWESLVSCTICTWSYTNKYNVGLHLYHNSMAATSLFRELNNRDTIAHNIANLVCGHLIFYNQVRYTAGKSQKIYFHTICNPPCRVLNKKCF